MNVSTSQSGEQRLEETLAIGYGNLCASMRLRPIREAFKRVAMSRGMTEEHFERWASKLEWG